MLPVIFCPLKTKKAPEPPMESGRQSPVAYLLTFLPVKDLNVFFFPIIRVKKKICQAFPICRRAEARLSGVARGTRKAGRWLMPVEEVLSQR
jgi:hypothetical protein